jgi:citrate synthase
VTSEAPITIAGRNVTELIGQTSFTEAFLLAVDGALPDRSRVRVVDAILVALMEHGITPSSLVTRTVLDGAPESTTGAVAAGLLAIGSQFLGTISEAAGMLQRIGQATVSDADLEAGVLKEVDRITAVGGRVPGLGHNLHLQGDPRVPLLLDLAREEEVAGVHVRAFEVLPDLVARNTGMQLVPNAAGAIGAILSDLGYDAVAISGFAVVARCAGLFSHVLDERRQPIARAIWESANASYAQSR